MRPVTPWLMAAVPPELGETHLDYYGPVRVRLPDGAVSGFLILTNYRILFVRGHGPGAGPLVVQFGIPWMNVTHVAAQYGQNSVGLTVNHLYFEGATSPGVATDQLASEMRHTIVQTRMRRVAETRAPPPPPPSFSPTFTREIVREVVKVPCRYCGTLFELSDVKCPGCGAARKG
jgi:hypothetical protein